MGAILWFLLGPLLIVSCLNLSVGIAVYNSTDSVIFNWILSFDRVENVLVWLQVFSAAVAVSSVLCALIAHFCRKYICAILYGCNALITGLTAALYFFVVPQM